MSYSNDTGKPHHVELRVVRFLITVEQAVVGLITTSIVMLVMVQVVARYGLDNPFRWANELAQVALIWLVFIGAALVMAKNSHVTVDVFSRLHSRRANKVLNVIAQLAVVFAGAVFVISGYDTLESQMSRDLPASGWPAGIPFVGSLVGYSLVTLHAVINIWLICKSEGDQVQEVTSDSDADH